MPIYQSNITYRSGFHNSKKVNGTDDRVYNAEDIRRPYDTVFTDGIMPDADGLAGNTLRVFLTGEMSIALGAGHAKLGGAWFENERQFNITLDVAESVDRYDCVIIRNDDNEDVRSASVHIKPLYAVPTVSDLERTAEVYEICVGYVRVPAFATFLSETDIVDTRGDGSLCPIMRGVGATVVRTYRNTYFSEYENQSAIEIGIPQYNRELDALTVAIEGRIFTEGAQYTIVDNSQISLAIPLPVVGTRIDFEVVKNVNAAGAETVVREVGFLMTAMNAAQKVLDYHYYCNGVTDNITLSTLAQEFLNGGDDGKRMTIQIYGTLGATTPYSGAGTQASPYRWFEFGKTESTSRKVVFDFGNCSKIELNLPANTYNHIFYGQDLFVKNANVKATVSGVNSLIIGFYSNRGRVLIEETAMELWGAGAVWTAYSGTYNNCNFSVTSSAATTACFRPTNESVLILNGGEVYAYGVSESVGVVVVADQAEACVIVNGTSFPTVAKNGYVQRYAISDLTASGKNAYNNVMTTLTVSATGQSVVGTLAVNKPNRV